MKTYAELVDALRRLHILDAGQIDQLTRSVGSPNPDPRVIAKKLVAEGQLTHFQANHLFTGKANALLLGSYVLLEVLGEGGMGTVYRAKNWKLGQIVAVKLVRPERLANAAAIRRFQREIRASAKLAHANIVRTIDADEVGGNHLLVMEYVPGAKDLHKLIREQGALPIAQARRYLHQVAMGLQHAFKNGLVHRDIKPHNLLVSSGEAVAKAPAKIGPGPPADPPPAGAHTVKILDFGLALLFEGEDSTTLTKEGAVMGTVDYLAPEQAQNSHHADIRADLYSLGCTTYYMLTGQVPFAGGTVLEKMYKHQFEDARPVEQLRLETPPELGAIVRKLMAKRPEERYQTPEELVCDLDALAAGAPLSASSSSGLRIKPAAAPVPVAALAPSQAQRDTESPFAALGQSDTAVDAPVSVRLRTAPTPAPWKHAGLVLGIAGALGASIVLLVAVVLGVRALLLRPVEVPDKDRVVVAPPIKKPTDADTNPSRDRPDKKSDDKKLEPKKDPLTAQESEWHKWLAQQTIVRAKRAEDAESRFKLLESRANDKETTFVTFARELAAFQTEHGGTPAALRGAALLARLHSPLDELDASKLPADAKALWRVWGVTGATGASPDGPPRELVAVRGDHRGRHWGPVSHVQFVDAQDKVILSVGGSIAMLVDANSREPLAIVSPVDLWALSPNGKLFAAGSYDGMLQIYDLDARKTLWNIEAFAGGGVRSLAFSPDSQTLASGGGLNRAGNANAGLFVRLWDAATGKSRGNSATLDSPVVSLAYASDGGALAASTTSGQLHLLNPRKLQEPGLVPALGGPVQFLFSPDGKTLAAYWYSSKGLRLIDVGTRAAVLSADDLVGDAVARSVFSKDSTEFAFCEANGTVRLWKLPKELARKWHAHAEGGISTFVLTGDGRELWTASSTGSGDVKVWDTKSGKPLKGPPPYDGAISDLRISPDGNLVAWISGGKNIRIWRRDRQAMIGTIQRTEAGPFAFSNDAKHIVTGDLHMIRVWDTTTLLESSPLKGRSRIQPSLAFAPDGRLLLAADTRGTIHSWTFDPALEPDFTQWQFAPNNSGTPKLAFLADGQRFTTLGEGYPLLRWSLALDSAIVVAPNTYGCCISPQGRFGLVSAPDGHVTIWNLDTAKEDGSLQTREKADGPAGPDPRVIDMAVTPDERFALVLQGNARPRLLRLCALDTGKEVFRFKSSDCVRVAISPDGQHLLTTDYDGTCSLFNLHTGTLVRKIELGPSLAEHAAVFSPDGTEAAIATSSSLVLLDMPSGNRLKEWQFPGQVQAVAFAPDGRHLAVANGNGTLYLLRTAGRPKT